MRKLNMTESAIEQLKNGIPLTKLLKEADSRTVGDFLYPYLTKTSKSVEVVAGLADLNKSSLYRILNGETSPQRNVLLRLSRILEMNLTDTQSLLKLGGHATLSGSNPRDIVIISGILKEQDIADISEALSRNGYADLFAKMK